MKRRNFNKLLCSLPLVGYFIPSFVKASEADIIDLKAKEVCKFFIDYLNNNQVAYKDLQISFDNLQISFYKTFIAYLRLDGEHAESLGMMVYEHEFSSKEFKALKTKIKEYWSKVECDVAMIYGQYIYTYSIPGVV